MHIKYKGQALDLPKGFSLAIEETSPIYNEEGSQSVSASVPSTARNRRLFGFPYRLDSSADPNSPRRGAEVEDGLYHRSGLINITEASREGGITFNLGFDNSTAYSEWHDKRLKELSGLPRTAATPFQWIVEFGELYAHGSPMDDYSVFPVALSKTVQDEESVSSKTYWEMVNVPDSEITMEQPQKVMRIIDGTPTQVAIPRGYGLTPFLKVWRVLELIFADLGVEIVENPFKQRIELARLVVLNNTADAICSGTLDYSELLPDCTVAEFMQALYVRFGLIYNIDSRLGTVTMRLLDDIVKAAPVLALDRMLTSLPKVIFDTPQYIQLTAATSIEGAAPACERFEDYVKGLDLRQLHVGENVGAWHKDASSGGWEGEFADGPEWEPEYPEGRDPGDIPDPWEDYDQEDWRDDDRDDGRRMAAGTRSSTDSSISDSRTWLGRETVTGAWWKLDWTNGLKKDSSTGFFEWNPSTPGMAAMSLNSVDECVPVVKASTGSTGTGNLFSGYLPAFLVGARHFHTYIKGNDGGEEDETTPLAFMWAYNLDGSTIGRNAPENEEGLALDIDDDGEAGPTLYFQFADGLFANFWQRYDELLRHGMRTIEIETRLPKSLLNGIDILSPVLLNGCPCLIDRIEYALPSPGFVKGSIRLRTISTLGKYNIAKEQGIPAVAMTAVGLGWAFYEGDWQAAEDAKRPAIEAEALRRFREMFADLERPVAGGELVIDSFGVVATGNWVEEMPLVLADSGAMPPAGTTKTVVFRGRIYFDCYLVKRQYDPDTDATISAEIVGDVLGSLYVDYTFDALYICTYVVRR